jgi:hypothetical protein
VKSGSVTKSIVSPLSEENKHNIAYVCSLEQLQKKNNSISALMSKHIYYGLKIMSGILKQFAEQKSQVCTGKNLPMLKLFTNATPLFQPRYDTNVSFISLIINMEMAFVKCRFCRNAFCYKMMQGY